jgi:hypothetical protein
MARQQMQMDASARIGHVALDPFGGVACVVVHCQVQLSVATLDPSQLIEQLHKQLIVLALSSNPVKSTRSEIERPGDPHFVVGAWRFQRSLVPSAHPAQTDFGIRFEPALVLEKRARFLEHRKHIPKSLLRFFSC